jgi:type I restriction enzyme, R subunit
MTKRPVSIAVIGWIAIIAGVFELVKLSWIVSNPQLQAIFVTEVNSHSALTGFDAPCMHTMYVDKPMQGHGLMQAIARVNRVFRDKPAGLIVDYIGVAQNLKSALSQYSGDDRSQVGIPEADAVAVMLEKYEIVREMFQPDARHGFDYRPALSLAASAQQRLAAMAGAIDWVLTLQQAEAAKATNEDAKKKAHKRYDDAVANLSKAYALAAASDEAQEIRDEVGFFQAIRIALGKETVRSGMSMADRELAIRQILSRAVVSTDIVDIMAAAGLETQDISILSDEFLAEVQNIDKKNLALEALRKLINGEVRAQSKTNVTQSRLFSDRLDDSIARYHSNAITTVQVLEELIQLAKDIKAARQRGGETGLNQEEIAFYDALAENQSAREMMGEPALRVIALALQLHLFRESESMSHPDWEVMDGGRIDRDGA